MFTTTMGSHERAYTIPFDGNRYCGPAALAYVMRSDPDSAATVIRKVSGKRSVMGCSPIHLLDALGEVGLTAKQMYVGSSPLRVWLDTFQPNPDEEFIVLITGHYIVIHGDRYFDSKCHLGKPASQCPYLRCWVRNAWKIARPHKCELPI